MTAEIEARDDNPEAVIASRQRRRGNPDFEFAINQSCRMKNPCVYILTSKRNGTLYIGVTSQLGGRVWQHKNNLVEGFTKKYSVHDLVWYEQHETMESAITREKQLKGRSRAYKVQLIEAANPEWRDLYNEIL